MQTETPEQLRDWLFQQKAAFERFFASRRESEAPHLSDLIPADHADLAFRGATVRRSAYLWENHYRPSHVAALQFSAGGVDHEVLIPAPREDGVFVVNGTEYVASFQRLWDSKAGEVAEYRRIDHVLLDGLKRRKAGSAREIRRLSPQEDTVPQALSDLKAYLRRVLNPSPSANDELLLMPLAADLNRWGVLAHQTQVRTLVVDWADGADSGKTAWKRGERPYRRVRDSEMPGIRARQPEDGLDATHTPEGKRIGLTRYLTLGSTIDDNRDLQPAPQDAVGLMAALVPFAQHDDAARVLMASSMMGRAVRPRGAGVSVSRTGFEDLIRQTVPDVAGEFVGVDLRVGFMFWGGLNYEDAVVVSESAADRLYNEVMRVVDVPVPAFCTATPRGLGPVAKGDALVDLRYSPVELGMRMPGKHAEAMLKRAGLFPLELELEGLDARCPCAGIIEKVETVELWKEDCPGAVRFSRRVSFTIRIDRPCRLGDKICNRHGNKGVISRIVPDAEMPRANGLPLEVLFNPIGVINRGNYGQVFEAMAGELGGLSSDIVPDPEARMQRLLGASSGPRLRYSVVMVPGPNGATEVNALVGTNYVLRLPHFASADFNVCRDKVFSSITEQPPKGVGQKYGEMEIAALQAHGAEAILRELCTDRSREPRSGEMRPCPQRPLVEWLRAVGLDLVVGNGPDGEVELRNSGDSRPAGKDLFDNAVKCDADPDCNAREGANERIPQATLFRRLCSEPFFEQCGGVYIDFGETVRLDLKTAEGKRELLFESQYLSIPHPRYRLTAPQGGTNKTTQCLMRLVQTLWRRPKRTDDKWKEDRRRSCEYLLRNLLGTLRGKNGIVRRVGLSRRLTYSARCVIVPGPLLDVDCVSLPWDAVRVLFDRHLRTGGWSSSIVDVSQDRIPALRHEEYAAKINDMLKSEWILINRAPTLHKYNVLAFRPRVHFDCWAMRIPPAVTTPFAADHDGDHMSIVPLFSEPAKLEASRLSIPSNLMSVADRSPIPTLTKDFQLGLYLCGRTMWSLSSLNDELKAGGFPPLPSADDMCRAYEQWVLEWPDSAPGFPAALRTVMKHALQALERCQNQSCLGELQPMADFLVAFRESKSAKTEKLLDGSVAGDDACLLAGVKSAAMRLRAIERVKGMASAKLAVGDFGGFQRRLYYRIRGHKSGGLAFEGDMQAALASIQSLTERATQRALSAKRGTGSLVFDEFEWAMEGMVGGKMPPQEIQALLGFSPDCLNRHMQVLADQVLGAKEPVSQLVAFLEAPFDDGMPDQTASSRSDPRIGVFIA